PECIYCGSVKVFVWLAVIKVALSGVMADTRHSPNLSPTKSILPAIMAAGRFGLKTMPCNFSGSDFEGAGGADNNGEPSGTELRGDVGGRGAEGVTAGVAEEASGAFRSDVEAKVCENFSGVEVISGAEGVFGVLAVPRGVCAI